MKLSTPQILALRDLRDKGPMYLPEKTAQSLIKRELAEGEKKSYWYGQLTITPAGISALDDALKQQERGPGRPRKHNSQAERQWDYRQRKEQRLDDLQKYVQRAAERGHYLAKTVTAGTGQQTLKNLAEYFQSISEGKSGYDHDKDDFTYIDPGKAFK